MEIEGEREGEEGMSKEVEKMGDVHIHDICKYGLCVSAFLLLFSFLLVLAEHSEEILIEYCGRYHVRV